MPLWTSLLPPLIAIVIALVLRQVIPALLVGLWVGSWLVSGALLPSTSRLLTYVSSTVTDRGNLDVLLFLFIFSGLVGLIRETGGTEAFAAWLEGRIASRTGTVATAWGLLPVTFIDCGFRVMATGSIMRPLARDRGISSEYLAYILNNSASPVVSVIPAATTFVAYMAGVAAAGLRAAGVDGSGYALFVRSIPYQFFSWTSIVVALASVFWWQQTAGEHGGGSPAAADDSRTAASTNGGAEDSEIGGSGTATDAPMQGDARTVWNLVLPIAALIALTFYLMIWDGEGDSLAQLTATASASRVMLMSIFLTTLLAGASYLLQGYDLERLTNAAIEGGSEILPTIIILALAWPIADVSTDLGLPAFIEGAAAGALPAWAVPAAGFAATGAVTYFIGSSWGAWALMMPLVLTTAATAGGSLALAAAAVFSGGTFGDVTSPVSGMTVMAAGAAGADHGRYVRLMTPYNMAAALLALAAFLLVTLAAGG